MGDVDGKLAHGVGRQVQGDPCAGLVLGSRGREDEEDHRSSGARGGAVSPPERPQLLPGKETQNTLVFTLGCVYTAGFAWRTATTGQAQREHRDR